MINRLFVRLSVAGIAAALSTAFLATSALAQDACSITVTPSTVAVGQQFTVSGNFGGAQVFLVRGANASPAEGASPDATTPPGGSFTVTFTAEAGDQGTWTVWGLIPASECGASASLTITAATIPNTAMDASTSSLAATPAWMLAFVVLIAVGTLVAATLVRQR